MKNKRLAKFIEQYPARAVEIGGLFHKKTVIPKKWKRVQYLAWVGAFLFTVSSEGLFKLMTNTQGEQLTTFEDFLTDFCKKNSVSRSQVTALKTIHSIYFALKSQGHRPESIDLLVTLQRISDNDKDALGIYKKEADFLARHPTKGCPKKVTAAYLKRKYKKDDCAKSAALVTTITAPSVASTVTPPSPPPNQPSSDHTQRDKDIALLLHKAVSEINWNGVVACIRLLDPALEIPQIGQHEVGTVPLPQDAVKQPEGNSATEVMIDSTETHCTADGLTPACQSENPPCQFPSLSNWQRCELITFRVSVRPGAY